ncbi:MAG: T9SS type A sorting domain-containing protein [Bacteroidetes bacterium]|jgi:hypothetical protein|nr:T9SS type A sorting domain-containing protein [Bacteroidota bacterium]
MWTVEFETFDFSVSPIPVVVWPLTMRLLRVVFMSLRSRWVAPLYALPFLIIFMGAPAFAQTGPGGVGNAAGSGSQPENVLWLRGDAGLVTSGGDVIEWTDQSGNGNSVSDNGSAPTLSAGAINGEDGVSFSNGQFLERTGGSFLTGSDALTMIAVVQAESSPQDIAFLDADDDGADNQDDNPSFRYDDGGANSNRDDIFKFGVDVSGGNADQVLESSEVIGTLSTQSTAPRLYTTQWSSGSDIRFFLNALEDNAANGTSSNGNTSGGPDLDGSPATGTLVGSDRILLGTGTKGSLGTTGWDGDIVEVIVYRSALNEAQRRIVNAYLVEKYGLTTDSGAEVEPYAYGAAFFEDFAGIGQATDGSQHLAAQSDPLRLQSPTTLGSGDFVLFGHDGADASTFTLASSGPLAVDADDDGDADAERMERRWRVDLRGSSPVTVEAAVASTDLPSNRSGYDYVVIVDDAADFSGDPVVYDLTDDGSGTLTGDVTLSDGQYVTIGAVQRVVDLASGPFSDFENTNTSVPVTINYPYTDGSTAVDVGFTITRDLDASGTIEDSGPGNTNGNYEPTSSDLSTVSTNPVSLSPGTAQTPITISLDNDGLVEQTEQFDLLIDPGTTSGAAVASGATARVSILDDDDPRKLSFSTPSPPAQSEGSGGTTRIETFTIEMPSSEQAAVSSPLSSVEFVVDGSSTAGVGLDFSDPAVDVRIVDESSGPLDADGRQQRLSPTSGRVTFDNTAGTTTAQLKLEINEDDVDDAASETVVIDLANPVSSALATTDTRLTFTLTDDETAPTVAFAQASSSGLESTNGSVEVNLSSPSGQTVEVDFGVDDAASTADRGPGDDFSLGTASPLTFSPGQTSASIVLNVNDDAQDELGETAILDLTGATGATVDAPNRHTYTIEDNDAPPFGAIGPGGVGDASTLALWLSPTDGITEDGSNRVSNWADLSGNGRDVAQSSAGDRPAFNTTTVNGLAVPEFDGSGQFLSNTDGTDDFLTGEDAFTLFAVTRSNQTGYDQAFFDTEAPDNNDDELGVRYDDFGNNSGRDDILKLGITTSGSQGAQQLETSTSIGGRATQVMNDRVYGVRWTTGSDLQFYMDGVEDADPDLDNAAATGTLTGANDIYIGIGTKGATGSTGWNGAIGDVIAYREPLGTTRLTIVQNYLSAKYGIDLNTANGAVDVYAGDTGSNGDYDRGVFGIGRTSAGDFHSAAQADGLRFDLTTGFEDGDYLLAGHATPTNSVNTADISGPAGLAARMDRVWYVDATNAGSALTTSFRFDLSDAGLAASVNPDPSGYVLLYRSGQSGSWSTVSTGGVSTNDDQITFSGVSSASAGDGYYTLGTTDRADSPLSGTAITIVGNSGDEGDATVGELGGDAGWRLIGPPVEGATAGDLISGSDTNGSVIEFTVAQGSMFYRWDDTIAGSPDDGGWSPINTASTAFQNGRGYLLFLFDDVGIPDADPLNPSITIDVATGTVPTSNVTVGDGTPASDPEFNRDASLHLLANPFNDPYDLTSLADGNGNRLGSGGSRYQAIIQIWDGGATTAEDNAQAGSYVTATVNGTASQDGTGNMVLQSGSDVISAWQGFFVERTNPGGGGPPCSTPPGSGQCELTFDTAGITTGDRRIVGSKSTATDRSVRVPLQLTVTNDTGDQVARDEAASLYFHPDATEGWDAFDASKLTPLTSRYALIGPVGALRDTAAAPAIKAQESRSADVEDVMTIPFALQTEGDLTGQARVQVSDWSEIPGTWSLTLIDTRGTPDTRDDVQHGLTQGSAYTFPLDTSAKQRSARTSSGVQRRTNDAGRIPFAPPRPDDLILAPTAGTRGASKTDAPSPPRFQLQVETDGALPVEYARFDASINDRRVALNWATTSESGNDGFHVEHQRLTLTDSTTSPDAWQSLGFVDGANQSERTRAYQFETRELDYGTHAFRLRQVDISGSVSYSQALKTDIRLDRPVAVQAPYPNPVRHRATLNVTVREQQSVRIQLYDILGRRVSTIMDAEIPAQETRDIQIDARRLASGLYFLRIEGEDFSTTERMTVVK